MRNRPRHRIRAKERVRKTAKREREEQKRRARKKEREKESERGPCTYTHSSHDPHLITNTHGHGGKESEVIPGFLCLALLSEKAVMCRMQPVESRTFT